MTVLRKSNANSTVTPPTRPRRPAPSSPREQNAPSRRHLRGLPLPACERFEKHYGNDIITALNNGQITVRFHTIAILDQPHHPARLLHPRANAALCAASAGIYPAYREKLFAEQPREGSSGLTNQQLVDFGTRPRGHGRLRARA